MDYRKSFLPQKAFKVFDDASSNYREHGCFSEQNLEELHSYFGKAFFEATEMIDKVRVIKYTTPHHSHCSRWVYEISSPREQFLIFDSVNFCQCEFFNKSVLESGNSITCRHVLALILAKIMGRIREETLLQPFFSEYLNGKLLRVCNN